MPAISPAGIINTTYGNYHEECKNIFKAFILAFRDIYLKNNFFSIPNNCIIWDRNLFDLIEEFYPKFWEDSRMMYSSYFISPSLDFYKSNILKHITGNEFYNFGILQNISLNLPRYAFITQNENSFLELLSSKIKLCSRILRKKHEIIKKRIFYHFDKIYPDKFINVTNGITPRRWLKTANPFLSKIITEKIDDNWIYDLNDLRKLEQYVDDEEFKESWRSAKWLNKRILDDYIEKDTGLKINPESKISGQIQLQIFAPAK